MGCPEGGRRGLRCAMSEQGPTGPCSDMAHRRPLQGRQEAWRRPPGGLQTRV
eukprot:NODE_1987_length_1232_cov_11.315300_g1649_i0.p4 GENE.NODE_1987_length_1232_cov_11.315300_g1649_i0~~NODE_1987_length_1232_cov_11.315300_g1649_i0.p4  ORF type:complete len:52 (-),score=1.01 NODE_1987_length_1232_cov_11.315300_g1649_i0:389-544(-)